MKCDYKHVSKFTLCMYLYLITYTMITHNNNTCLSQVKLRIKHILIQCMWTLRIRKKTWYISENKKGLIFGKKDLVNKYHPNSQGQWSGAC